MDGSEEFYRNWSDYQNGFGNKSGEFWLGKNNIILCNVEHVKNFCLKFFSSIENR